MQVPEITEAEFAEVRLVVPGLLRGLLSRPHFGSDEFGEAARHVTIGFSVTCQNSVLAYLGHKNIQHTVRYTELAPSRFKDFWRD